MATHENEENENTLYCETCDFKCSYKSDYARHLLTAKHQMATNGNKWQHKWQQPTSYMCDCGRAYMHRASLYKHKKVCKKNDETAENEETVKSPPPPENIVHENIVHENIVHESMSEATLMKCFQMMMDSHATQTAELEQAHAAASAEQNRLLVEAISLNGPQCITNNNNTTNNNNQFNLNVFLNEDCKDAFTLKEVADSIECTVSDLDRMDTDGYAATITRKILESIQHMSITERPIHCTDARRNTVCVKSKEGWERNEAAMKCLNNTVYWVGNKLGRIVSDWRVAYPDHFRGSDSRREQYHRLVMDVTDVRDRDVEARIASKICKGVILDRKVAMM
jgi:hypothetical protein